MMHLQRTYRDGIRCIRYCCMCSVEEDQPEWAEPCPGKVVDNKVSPTNEKNKVDKISDQG